MSKTRLLLSFTKLRLFLLQGHKYETLSENQIHYILVIVNKTSLDNNYSNAKMSTVHKIV